MASLQRAAISILNTRSIFHFIGPAVADLSWYPKSQVTFAP
ncbi:hypothetical protein RHECNPAF_122100139 [Rhizobium etli CNPAF512]|nr:hypothetical protein RHECNPAF_122100139 [Rhizobium etli CNPAF512]